MLKIIDFKKYTYVQSGADVSIVDPEDGNSAVPIMEMLGLTS